MNDLCEMNEKVARGTHDKIKKFCAPLVDAFGLSQFYYYRLMNNGQYVSANMNSGWAEHFYFENLYQDYPFFRHPDQFQGGVHFLQGVEHESYDALLKTASEKFNINYCLQIDVKKKDGIEVFGFGLDSRELTKHIRFVHEIPLLKLFIHKFQNEIASQLSVLKDNEINLAALIGPKFSSLDMSLNPNPVDRNALLKQVGIGMTNPFTPRERDVMRELLNGSTASQIADELMLSKRTVEHYLERLKDKLAVFTKSDLIRKARILESAGYFMP